MAMVLHVTKLVFPHPEGQRTPPQLLIARAPAGPALRLCLQARHHALDQMRGLEAHAQLGELAQFPTDFGRDRARVGLSQGLENLIRTAFALPHPGSPVSGVWPRSTR